MGVCWPGSADEVTAGALCETWERHKVVAVTLKVLDGWQPVVMDAFNPDVLNLEARRLCLGGGECERDHRVVLVYYIGRATMLDKPRGVACLHPDVVDYSLQTRAIEPREVFDVVPPSLLELAAVL